MVQINSMKFHSCYNSKYLNFYAEMGDWNNYQVGKR